jgi:hypothetical protein
VEIFKLILFTVFKVVITLLPQSLGLAAYTYLRRTSQRWASVTAVLLPPLGFFILVYAYIKQEESNLQPTEYWMAVGFGFLVMYAYLVFGTILNLVFGLVVQLILFRRRRKPTRTEQSSLGVFQLK